MIIWLILFPPSLKFTALVKRPRPENIILAFLYLLRITRRQVRFLNKGAILFFPVVKTLLFFMFNHPSQFSFQTIFLNLIMKFAFIARFLRWLEFEIVTVHWFSWNNRQRFNLALNLSILFTEIVLFLIWILKSSLLLLWRWLNCHGWHFRHLHVLLIHSRTRCKL